MPPPSSEPPDWDRPATVLETEEDIRRAKAAGAWQEPGPPAQPRPTPAPSAASPYRPTARPPVPVLTVFDDGKSDGEAVRIRTERFVIGRCEGDFFLPHDQQISARHLEITRHKLGDKYRWVITDLQTANGLFIRVSRTVLPVQAEILVGGGRYRIDPPDAAAVEPIASAPPGTISPDSDLEGRSHPALVELAGQRVVSRLPLRNAEYWIGSDLACAICRAADPFVEPRHVQLIRDAAGTWHARNNKSLNGLWLRVPQITVDDACLFQIGEQRLRLKVGG